MEKGEARAIMNSIASGEVDVPMKDGFSAEEFEMKNNETAVSSMLRVNDRGCPYQTLGNNLTVLENDYYLRGRFGYDTFTLENTVEPPLPWDAKGKSRRPLKKEDLREFAVYAEKYLLRNEKRAATAVEIECHRNEHDSAQQLLESLSYDGSVHREEMLRLFMGAEDSAYTRAVSKLTIDALVMRVMHPGCKYDYILALIGPQGIGKSELTKKMALQRAWHIDKIGNLFTKDGLELLRAKTVYEIAELSDIKGAKRERIKQWVTSEVDTYRAPYDILSADHPRRFIVIATTNEASFLDDPTGNRRWLPVHCIPGKSEMDIFNDKESGYWFEQAYAEAMVEYRENGGSLPLTLPVEVAEAAEAARDAAYIEDPDEGRIAAYMMDNPNAKICTSMILQNVYYDNNIPTRDTPTSRKVASILNSFEWLKKGEKKERLDMYGTVRWWMYEI